MNKKIVVSKGDSIEINMTVVDVAGQPEPLNGAAIVWFVAEKADSPALLIEKTVGNGITVTDANLGRIAIRATGDDTRALLPKDYFTAIRVTFADGRVKTAAREYITIVPVPGTP